MATKGMGSPGGLIRPRPITSKAVATPAKPLALTAISSLADSEPVGAGLIIPVPEGQTSVLTCAHVIAAALGTQQSSVPPAGSVKLRPWADPSASLLATVRPDGWFPIDEDGRGDVAVLRPVGQWPDGVAFAALSEWSGRQRSRWQAFGYPERYKQVGQHASGRFIGRFGPGNEWVQIDAEVVVGYRIVPGYSGSPVWELEQNSVVGVAVSEDAANPSARSGGMLPIEVAASYWKPLEPHIRRGARDNSVVLDRSWLSQNYRNPPEPTSLGFTVTNTGRTVVKVMSMTCRVMSRSSHWYDSIVAGIPERYEIALQLDADHDEYELLARQHILQPMETEEYEVIITAGSQGMRYRLSLELCWRAVDGSAEGIAFLDPFDVYH